MLKDIPKWKCILQAVSKELWEFYGLCKHRCKNHEELINILQLCLIDLSMFQKSAQQAPVSKKHHPTKIPTTRCLHANLTWNRSTLLPLTNLSALTICKKISVHRPESASTMSKKGSHQGAVASNLTSTAWCGIWRNWRRTRLRKRGI